MSNKDEVKAGRYVENRSVPSILRETGCEHDCRKQNTGSGDSSETKEGGQIDMGWR